MDLLQIGSRCSQSSCVQIDFLPVLCRCNKYFCRHHIASDLHSCPIDLVTANLTTPPSHKLQRCAIETCVKPSLNAFNSNPQATCSQCRKSFCSDHRHPKSHLCRVKDTSTSQKSASARVLLTTHFPPSGKKAGSLRTTKVPTDPIKLAHHRRLELMKMRHHAAPGNPTDSPDIPQDQRLHLRLKVGQQTEKVFWFRKTAVTGKVLDCLASHVGVTSSTSHPLQLLKVSSVHQGKCVLRNDQAIADNAEDGELLVIAPLE